LGQQVNDSFLFVHVYATAPLSSPLTNILGNSSYAQVAAKPSPLIGTPITDQNPPDVASSPIPVTYNGKLATAREGGVSIIMPNHWQATANIASSLGSWITNPHGSAVEPSYLVSNNAYDIARAGYAGNAPGVPFFTQNEYTPDYYVSSHRPVICQQSFWTICPPSSYELRSLGTAEFLDMDNCTRTMSAAQSAGVGPGTNYTFAEIYCHVNAYDAAAATFVPATTQQQNKTRENILGQMPSVQAMFNASQQMYEQWDYALTAGAPASSVETPRYYRLNPDAGC
jgi:hypothetical protein